MTIGKGVAAAAMLGLGLAGCVTTETVRFQAGPQQQAMIRDGRSAIVSTKKASTVVVSPAQREIGGGQRPVFVVGIQNRGKAPQDFYVQGVEVIQSVPGQPPKSLPVLTYEQLVSEERTRQVVTALLVGAAAAGNSYNASRAGYGSYDGRTFYSPTAAAIANVNASAQNAAMIVNAAAQGEYNLAALERSVIKDNTLLPHEWYGGQLHIAPPEAPASGPKVYVIRVPVGDEAHEIEVAQGAGG